MPRRTAWCRYFGLVGFALLGGCASYVPKPQFLQQELAPRAAFDLHCDASKLVFSDLSQVGEYEFYTAAGRVTVQGISLTQGVSGCDTQATYIYTHQKWIMNSDQQQAAKPEAGGQ